MTTSRLVTSSYLAATYCLDPQAEALPDELVLQAPSNRTTRRTHARRTPVGPLPLAAAVESAVRDGRRRHGRRDRVRRDQLVRRPERRLVGRRPVRVDHEP